MKKNLLLFSFVYITIHANVPNQGLYPVFAEIATTLPDKSSQSPTHNKSFPRSNQLHSSQPQITTSQKSLYSMPYCRSSEPCQAAPIYIQPQQINTITQKDLNNLRMNHEHNLNMNHELTLNLHFPTPSLPTIPAESVSNVLFDTYETIKHHNKKLAFLLIGVGYLTACYQAYVGDNYSNQSELWANWRDDLSLEQLLSIPHDQLAQELLIEIQRRYITQGNPTDFISPLTSFLNSIELEIHKLEYYKRFNDWIQWLRISKLLPTKRKDGHIFNKQLQKLKYLKNIFLSWAAKYKLEQQEYKKCCMHT